MNILKKLVFSFSAFILCVNAIAQEGTRESDASINGKVMTIPFQSYMYMSEIDKKINEKTGWSHEQIKEYFRRNLDVQLMLKLKGKTQVVSFYKDSVNMAKDLDYTYKSRTLTYETIDPNGNKVTNSKQQKNITNGQLTVEMKTNKGYMTAKIINPGLLSTLNKKYGSVYFIFINELDIKYDLNTYDIAADAYQREVTVHYTIMDKNQKIISSGIAVSPLSPTEDNPKKIVETSLAPIAEYIAEKLTSATRVKKQ
jgi:hypothetical protein